jgi:aspartate/methionine/tyrosine aminotransferase
VKGWISKRAQAMPKSVFATMDAAKMRARARGLDLIDLSIGSSDLAPPEVALEALRRATYAPETYGYCLFSGTAPLRHAVATWFRARYGEALSADEQILPLIGSQEGFANLLLATTDPGDLILLPDPGYPSYYGAVALAGLKMCAVPLEAENGFWPDLGAIPERVARRAKVLVISYPNNPTAAVATPELMREAVAFCLEHRILLVHDFPYVDMVYGDYRAPSVLAQPGGLETAVELYSCSKSFHMGGFRIGWAAGNAEAIAALARVKGAVDFNQYRGIQAMAVAALEAGEAVTREAARILESRRDALVGALHRAGWVVSTPQASMYVWAPLPKGRDSFGFAVAAAEQTGVCVAPGRAFGERGEGYVRFALVRDAAVLERAAERLAAFLEGCG